MPQPISRQQKKETPAEAVFKAILAEDIEWKPFAAFPLNAVATRGEHEEAQVNLTVKELCCTR